MWKKRLIIILTFIAGLYYFLEFIVPPSLPWATTRGVVQSVTTHRVSGPVKMPGEKLKTTFESRIEIAKVQATESMLVIKTTAKDTDGYNNRDTKIEIITNTGERLATSSEAVKPGDVVIVTQPDGASISGIVMPTSAPRRVEVGQAVGTETVTVRYYEVRDEKEDTTVTSVAINTLLRRMRSRDAGEQTTPDKLLAGAGRSADWIEVGPSTYLSGFLTDITDFFIVLSALAWGMGLLSLWLVHSANIRKRRPEWYTSIIFFVSLVFGLLAGIGLYEPEVLGWWKWTIDVNYVVFWNILRPMGSSVFSLLTFFLASAAYRSFKAKSYEGSLMMISAIIVMLGQVSLNLYVTQASTWILYIVNNAAVRGMWFGMMLGGIAIGLRLWLSLERGAFFDREF